MVLLFKPSTEFDLLQSRAISFFLISLKVVLSLPYQAAPFTLTLILSRQGRGKTAKAFSPRDQGSLASPLESSLRLLRHFVPHNDMEKVTRNDKDYLWECFIGITPFRYFIG